MMIRSFLPIGQGACYIERFSAVDENMEKITVLYDCGSLTSLQFIKDCLSDNLKIGSTIHAIFISHFDEDHINGLPYLLKYYKVKNLFIPLITEDERKSLELSCICEASYSINNSFFTLFFQEYPYFRHTPLMNDTQVHFVRYEGEEGNSELDYPYGRDIGNRTVNSGYNASHIIFTNDKNPSNSENCLLYTYWSYVPFNFRQKSRIKILHRVLEDEFGEPITLKNALDLVKADRNNIERIKHAYELIPGNMNTNSMTLFSGPTPTNKIVGAKVDRHFRQYNITNDECRLSCHYCEYYRHYRRPITPAGCLYMGDYEANGEHKFNSFLNSYKEYWEYIGCIQIPHHGSKNNYNEKLTDNPKLYYVISAGKNNNFGHPHDIVVKDMLLKGSLLHVVTEERHSEFILLVECNH